MGKERVASLVIALVLAGCGGAPSASRRQLDETPGGYPGRCELVAIEYADAPRREATEPDALFLVASYRPTGDRARPPIEVRIRVRRASAEELRAQLEQNPVVACGAASEGEQPDVQVPDFDRADP